MNKNKNRGAIKYAWSLIKISYSRIVQIDMLKGAYGYSEEEAEQIRRLALEGSI